MAEFKRGRENIKDDPRSGKPVTLVSPKIVTKIHDIVMGDRRVTERYIARALGFLREEFISFLRKIWI